MTEPSERSLQKAREWYAERAEGWDALDSGAIPSLAALLDQEIAASKHDAELWAISQKQAAQHRAEALRRAAARGYEPWKLQLKWRSNPPQVYDSSECLDAILEALNMEGVAAWSGDATSCVEQMVRAQAERAAASEARCARYREALEWIASRLADGDYGEDVEYRQMLELVRAALAEDAPAERQP